MPVLAVGEDLRAIFGELFLSALVADVGDEDTASIVDRFGVLAGAAGAFLKIAHNVSHLSKTKMWVGSLVWTGVARMSVPSSLEHMVG